MRTCLLRGSGTHSLPSWPAEIETHTGIAEKTLSEFVLALSKTSKNVKDFKKQLDSNGAEFPESLVHTLWNIIQALQVRAGAPVHVLCSWMNLHVGVILFAARYLGMPAEAANFGPILTSDMCVDAQPKGGGAAKAANGGRPSVASRGGEFSGLTIEDTRDRARRLQQVCASAECCIHPAASLNTCSVVAMDYEVAGHEPA